MRIRVTHLQDWRALFGSERVVAHNVIVGSGTIAAGVLGVAFQSLVSHRLQPADYGAVFAVVSLITLIGLPASAFTLLMARETSRDRASGQMASSASLLRRGNRVLFQVGMALAVALALLSPLLTRFLDVPAQLLLAGVAGVPFGVALPLLLGEFQGAQRFLAFAVLSSGQAALKLAGAVTLGIWLGPLGIVTGISLATGVTYFAALVLLRRKLSSGIRASWWRPAAAYLVVVLPSTVALGLLLSVDILLVKHFFPTRLAGEYAAVAALGRAIFWGASGVAAVLFPKVVFRGAKGQSGSPLVGASLFLVGIGGLAGLAVLSFGSRWVLVAFAGSAYQEAAGYLPWYSIGMILLGCAAVLIATHQSRGTSGFLAVLLPLTALEPVLLLAFHRNLGQVVGVVDVSTGLVAGALGVLYLLQERRQSPRTAVVGSEASATKIAKVG